MSTIVTVRTGVSLPDITPYHRRWRRLPAVDPEGLRRDVDAALDAGL